MFVKSAAPTPIIIIESGSSEPSTKFPHKHSKFKGVRTYCSFCMFHVRDLPIGNYQQYLKLKATDCTNSNFK